MRFLFLIAFFSFTAHCRFLTLRFLNISENSIKSPNFTEYVVCIPRKNEKKSLMKLLCYKTKIEKLKKPSLEYLIEEMAFHNLRRVNKNQIIVYKKTKKFPYFKFITFFKNCDLSKMKIKFDMNEQSFYYNDELAIPSQ